MMRVRRVRTRVAVVATVVAGSVGCALASPASAHVDRPRFATSDGGHGVGEMGTPARRGIDGRSLAARTITVDPADGPDYEMPFVCGQAWTGTTRASHSPSMWNIDWNSPDDLGKPALASAPGVVTTSVTLSGSYGNYVVVDHGNGWSSLYAHLNQRMATVGQVVDQGDLIGFVGGTGHVTGPHLHFEEREDGAYFHPYLDRTPYQFSTTRSSANCNDRPLAGDWDGNGRADMGMFRSTPTSGQAFFKSDTAASNAVWGSPGDIPVSGDFNGDGKDQVGVRKLGSSTWLLRGGVGNLVTVEGVGLPSDVPITGDWDGDGRTELGYYRPSTRTFYERSVHGTLTPITFGQAGQEPVTGDWDGDGKTDIGGYSPATRTWSLRLGDGSAHTIVFGTAYDAIPVTGDWDGSGTTDIGVWRPSTGNYYKRVLGADGAFHWQITHWGRPRG